jgi:U3 small nucleolar RNA-associated protein 11
MVSRKGPSTGKKGNGTVNADRGNQVLSQDAVRLFKTQDLGYVRTMRNRTAKEVAALENQAVGIRSNGKKVVYVDTQEEQMDRLEGLDEEEEEEDEFDDEEEEDEDEPADAMDPEAKKLKKLQQREAEKVETRLQVARQRLRALAQAEEALELQRAKMAKSPSVGGVNKQGVKFKVRERKR